MTRVKFWGEAEITGGGIPVKPLLYVVAAIMIEAWVAVYLWAIALASGLVIAAMAAVVVFVRRRSDRDAEALARQFAGLQAEAAAGRELAAPKAVTIVNVQAGAHVHLTPGETVAGHIAPPVPGAVIRKE